MIKYIVGIDFGNEETAAWAVPLSEDNEAKLPLSGASLRLCASNDAQDRQLPSVIYRTTEGDYSLEFKIGSITITQMKKRVAEMSDMDKNNYSQYIRKVIKRLMDLNKDILRIENDKPNFKLYLASLNRWSDEEKLEDLIFFNSSIQDFGIQFDATINGGYGSFFSHCNEESDLHKCSLVIDYGASTIDYTAIRNGKIISDNSWSSNRLGSNEIDDLMFKTIKPQRKSGWSELSEMLNATKQMLESHNLNYIDPEQILKFEVRNLKEEIFKQQTDEYKLYFDFESITGNSDFESLTYVAKGKLSEVTQEYQEAVRTDLIDLRNKLSQKLSALDKTSGSQSISGKYQPDRIILSRGAYIMGWFNLMVREVFGIAEIVENQNSVFDVAKGIALYAKRCYIQDLEIIQLSKSLNQSDII